MTDDADLALDGMPEIIAPDEPAYTLPSTLDTKARYAFIRSKRIGGTWQEGHYLYRYGAGGVTCFDTQKWS